MSKCQSLICDVCKKHVDDDKGTLIIKAKRRWYSWHERGYESVKLCVCVRCQDKITELVNKEV